MALQKTQSQRVVFKHFQSRTKLCPYPLSQFSPECGTQKQASSCRIRPPEQHLPPNRNGTGRSGKLEEAPVVTLPLDLVMFQNLFKVNFGYFKTVTQSCGCHTLVTALTYGVTEMLTERSFKYFILLLSFRLYCVQRRFPERREAQE